MGPHFFKCGNNTISEAEAIIESGFNGAALFQVRKYKSGEFHVTATMSASMGPHFFKCGNRTSRESFM